VRYLNNGLCGFPNRFFPNACPKLVRPNQFTQFTPVYRFNRKLVYAKQPRTEGLVVGSGAIGSDFVGLSAPWGRAWGVCALYPATSLRESFEEAHGPLVSLLYNGCAMHFIQPYRVLDMLTELQDYNLHLIGHSMGAGVAAILCYLLNTDEALKAKLPPGRKVDGLGVATAACLSEDLCKAVAPYFNTLVRRRGLHDMRTRCRKEAGT